MLKLIFNKVQRRYKELDAYIKIYRKIIIILNTILQEDSSGFYTRLAYVTSTHNYPITS